MRLGQTTLAAVYGSTALALWIWFDTLDGLEPGDGKWLLEHHSLPRLAVYGMIAFVIATVVSFLSPRIAAWAAAAACLMSWPYWLLESANIRWNLGITLLNSVVGRPALAALLMMIAASAFTLYRLRLSNPK